MEAYLVISKSNEVIPFRFSTYQYKVKEKGQIVTKVARTGLLVFAKALEGYLEGIGVDLN
jgi:hypothetical protein